MATEIKRVRFFDGQFLKELEFRDEQAYHQHLRRRMNFFLFEKSGVVQIGTDDLRFFDLNNADKTFRVRAGMAICRTPLLAEGKEIVLFVDSPVIDLDAEGIVAGGTAFVTIHYEEEEAKDPPSEGDVDENTRVREKAVLRVHSSLPAGPAPNGEEFILLGTIVHTGMTADYTARHEAKLRASLLAAPVVPSPEITGLTGTTSVAAGGAPVAAVIHGTNLAGATAVAFGDPAVTAVVNSFTATTVNITVTAGPAAVAGPKSFTVTTPGGTASSPGAVNFTVTGAIPVPTITGIDVHAGTQGTTFDAVIAGTNLTGADEVGFSGAGVKATIQRGGTATSLPISIQVSATATVGARLFVVSTPGGTASSKAVVGADFTVTAAVQVTLRSLQPNRQVSGGTIEVVGTNIRNPALAPDAVAAGTTIQLRKAAVTVAAAPATIIVRPDVGGRQVVRVVIPDRPGVWGPKEAVTLDLTFNASTGSLEFGYDDTPPPPAFASPGTQVTPRSGRTNSLVTLQGNNFDFPPVKVLFGTTPATIEGTPETHQIVVRVPPNIIGTNFPIEVTTSGGTVRSTDTFFVVVG
jgi:hypothetical protein